jgi:Flp pilus assembly protein TadD
MDGFWRSDGAGASNTDNEHGEPRPGRAAADRGLALVREARWDDALSWFQRAVDLEPSSVEFLRYLAETAACLRRYAEVKTCCLRILEIDPSQAVIHNALGWVFQDGGQPDHAMSCYQSAIALEPRLAPAHYNLGTLHEELGRLTEAEASYRTVLRIDESHSMALSRLASLACNRLPDADLSLLRDRLSDPSLDPADRANLLFALAQVLDARRQFMHAAHCLEEANSLAERQLRQHGRAYDPAEHDRFVDATIAAWTPALFDRLAGAGLDTRRPVFVFGLPRSGTTLIEQILASHPAVHGAGEIALVRETFDEIPGLTHRAGHALDCLVDLTRDNVGHLARRHDDRLRELDGGLSQCVVNKWPENYFYLGLIAVLFPRAVFIHCQRDPRDVALSCWSTNFKDVRWANHVDHIAGRFAGYRKLMSHWHRSLPVAVYDVDYERTVSDLEGVARRLVSLCGLSWDAACLDYHHTRRAVRTASAAQVRKPLYTHAVGRWKSYERGLGGLFAKVVV